MTPEQLEKLLYEEESPTLDFKRDQYAFSKASDEEKSELLKDILGFVNCWRRSDAFIVIGVQEVQGGRSVVQGIFNHLQDHSLQQFVNNLTNRPVRFGYEACEIEGKQVGVLRIDQQKRPIYLKRDYGKLKRGEVYVRRGSSTDPTKPADPDEIAHMGTDQSVVTRGASLAVDFAELHRERVLGAKIGWTAEYCQVPSANEIPTLTERRSEPIQLPSGQTFHIPDLSGIGAYDRLNSDYFRKLAQYIFRSRLVRQCRLVVTNTGDIPAEDVRLEICVSHGAGYGILRSSDIPDVPKRRVSIANIAASMRDVQLRSEFQQIGVVNVERTEHETKVEVDCGNLQPGRKVWTDELNVAVAESGEVKLEGYLYAANLSQPQSFTLSINAQIEKTSMTVEELTSMSEPDDGD